MCKDVEEVDLDTFETKILEEGYGELTDSTMKVFSHATPRYREFEFSQELCFYPKSKIKRDGKKSDLKYLDDMVIS